MFVDLNITNVAVSEAIRLPTLRELIGYPTTYDFTVTAPSVFSHLPRFDVDNDISRQTADELGDLPSELASDREGELAEETGNSWLRQASESKVRSRAAEDSGDAVLPEERAAVTNAIEEDENGQTYLKPTTMRGIPLESLTSSSVMRGFYVTKSHDDSSTWTESLTSTYSPTEQQAETTSIPDVSTIDEGVTGARDEPESSNDGVDDHANDIINDGDAPKFTTFGSSAISSEDSDSAEVTVDYEEVTETTGSPVDEGAFKKGKSLRDFARGGTSLPNAPVVSPTTPTRRAIAVAVSRYNELTTPLWAGRRIVGRKRVRTTVSPIRDAIKRTEGGFVRGTASVIGTASSVASTTPSTIPTTPVTASESATGPIDEETGDSGNRASTTEATTTLTTDSTTAESDPSTADFVEDLASKITDGPETPASASFTDDAPTVAQSLAATDPTITTTTFVVDETTSANYPSAAAVGETTAVDAAESTTGEAPATANYLAIPTEAYERSGTNAPTTTEPSAVQVTTDTIVLTDPVLTTYKPAADVPATTSVPEVTSDPATTLETTSTEAEAPSTIANYPWNTVPTTVQEEPSTTGIPETTMVLTEIESTTAYATDPISTTASVPATIPVTTDLPYTVAGSATPAVTSVIPDTSPADPETTFATWSEVPAANAGPTSSSTEGASSTTESPAISFTAPTDVDSYVEVSTVTETAKSTYITELPTTFETTPTLVATTTVTPSFLATDSGTTLAATIAPSTEIDEASATPTVIPTSSTFLPIANTVTVALGEPTVFSSVPAISHESIATNVIPGTTARSIYEVSSARATTSEESSRPKAVFEETTVRPAQNRTRGRTRAELAAIGHEFGQRTSGRTVVHRRVVKRPVDGNVEMPTTTQPTRQYPRRRVTVYRGRPRKPTHTTRVAEENRRRRIVQKRLRAGPEATSDTVRSDENVVDVQDTTSGERVAHVRVEGAGRRKKVILKRVREKSGEKGTSVSPAVGTMVLGESFSLAKDEALRARGWVGKVGRRRKVVLKRIKPPQPEGNSERKEASGDTDSPGHQPGRSVEVEKMRKRTRVVLKRLRPKSEGSVSASGRTRVNADSSEENLTHALPTDLHADDNLADEGNARRRMRVVLKSVKLASEERNASGETHADPDATKETLRGDFSSSGFRAGRNLYGERTGRRMRVVLKNVRPKSEKETDAAGEEGEDPESTGDDLQGNFSNNMYVSDDLADDRRKTTTRSKGGGEEETTTSEQQTEPRAELRTTETTSVRVEEDTDRPSHEVNTLKNDAGGSVSRQPVSGRSNRQRAPTTTLAPFTNTLASASSITHRRSRPFAETTLSARIDLVDPHEVTESSYARSSGAEVDQRADVSDQSIRAQEFAVTLADPPHSSSSDTGRVPLRNAERRKISTTITPRTEPTLASRAVSRYDGVSRSRQGPKTKDRLTVNATTRPRKPPVVDYDYYEDEVPIVAGKSLLNGKLFLTSKGTIRCLDQGNFPHPYSCKKFITCARMVNGQVIGTEYTCPAKLSFDPVGGICNWSAGLGCKD
ncbi:PREDICTED: mucin-19-like [Dinoponera quadriceps]|uniref:Mucin-19-like n=1 Tax=Dinoponera quadriceps TaxID=609295 RepID=A0A6P3XQQ1_DINQU|nr:PREDICTED: mucin-19-like [Dinoponera quadriceps]